MTASELAFLGLGLLLGAATGAAFLVVLGSRRRRREIRVTVTRDALPRRSETLSQDAFVTSPRRARARRPGRPALVRPGRRRARRQRAVRPPPPPEGAEPRARHAAQNPAPVTIADRTIVPYRGGRRGRRDPCPRRSRRLTASSPAGRRGRRPLERMLRGEHRAMVEVVDRIAGEDSRRRRDWELLLGGLVEAMADIAVGELVLDFPMGTAFWDTFTVEQCRRIVGALASMGFRYDGRAGWVENRVPAYRDLAQALADIGRRAAARPGVAEPVGDRAPCSSARGPRRRSSSPPPGRTTPQMPCASSSASAPPSSRTCGWPGRPFGPRSSPRRPGRAHLAVPGLPVRGPRPVAAGCALAVRPRSPPPPRPAPRRPHRLRPRRPRR